MDAPSEAEVILGRRSIQAQRIGIFEHCGVAVGRGPHEQHPIVLPQIDITQLARANHVTEVAAKRCFEAEHLFDEGGYQARLRPQRCLHIGMRRERQRA